MDGARLAGIVVYPLKSARGVICDVAVVEERGLRHDRRWMLIDQDGEFLTQRTEPKLATLGVALPDGPTAGDGAIVLSADGLPDLHVPVPDPDAARLPAVVWRDRVDAQVADGEANAWLGEFMGRTAWLAHMSEDARRPTQRAPEIDVSFADGYPYLLCNEASLADLNARLDAPLPMDRFRANLIVEGPESWAEFELTRFRIGGVEFEAVKPCERCVVVTMDQTTGERTGPAPLKALVGRDGDQALFGMNLVAKTEGRLRIGDLLEIA